MREKKVIFIIGRDNWQKDDTVNKVLISYLKKTKHKIVWEDPAGNLIYNLRAIENRIPGLPNYIRIFNLRVLQILFGLFHRGYFSYIAEKKHLESIPIELRTQKLKNRLLKLGTKRKIIILSRSAGGRLSSLIADELKIEHLICLGYPFKHPQNAIEPERYIHLKDIKTPMLIIQGDKDEYGGLEVINKYALSHSIEICFIPANHNFRLKPQDWEAVLNKMDKIICSNVWK